jgi:D-beta-D-heptose 7-phosphate kinase/D-beta-D-heptose 1-phosphate adenosyltransferase
MTFDISAFKKLNILVIGDLMIDEYVWGDVDRISPEAPVPVVRVNRENFTLGGAGNVINNIVSMGASVSVIGTAGTGKTGKQLLAKLAELGVEIDGIVSEPYRPTTRKTRIIASSQQVLRIDRETKESVSADTFDRLLNLLEKKTASADLVIISDYSKGLVTKELVASVSDIARKNGILCLADPKGMNFLKYENVHILTPNRKETALASGMEINSTDDLIGAGEKILESARLEKLLVTCGKDGMLLFEKDQSPFRIQSMARQVFDVSGAGDTVISILGLCLAAGASFRRSAEVANAAAGIVVGKVGTATATAEELAEALKSYPV